MERWFDMSERRPGGDSSVGYDESWFYATAKELHDYPVLEEDIRADVCIIGAGYTGISAALELAERGYSVVVLESHKVGSGASGRNGGVLGMQQCCCDRMIFTTGFISSSCSKHKKLCYHSFRR